MRRDATVKIISSNELTILTVALELKTRLDNNNGTLKAAIFKICSTSGAPAIFLISGACAAARPRVREKLTFEGAAMHLELRSPMFGEKCIAKFICDFQWN